MVRPETVSVHCWFDSTGAPGTGNHTTGGLRLVVPYTPHCPMLPGQLNPNPLPADAIPKTTAPGSNTVTVKAVLVLEVPSLTVSVIRLDPVPPGLGVTFTVRAEPLPPNTMLVPATSAVFAEVALKVNVPGSVAPSDTVTASGPVAPFWGIVRSATEEIGVGSVC